MNEKEFRKYFDLFPKGNFKDAWNELIYHISLKKEDGEGHLLSKEHVCAKWKQYITKAQENNTDEKYIKSMSSFVKNEDYQNNFDLKSAGKKSYISKWDGYEK